MNCDKCPQDTKCTDCTFQDLEARARQVIARHINANDMIGTVIQIFNQGNKKLAIKIGDIIDSEYRYKIIKK